MKNKAEKTKYYVVWKGRKTGIFSTWEACSEQVNGFRGAHYKSFSSRLAAEQAFRGMYQSGSGKQNSSQEWLFSPHPPVAASVAVDAACSGSPGQLEFRGVDLSTGKEIFHRGPYRNGTNNVGEFLAIVHAFEMLAGKGMDSSRAASGAATPVYSDSDTAIGWVKAKRCNTKLVADGTNTHLFRLIRRAEAWLVENVVIHPVLKWDTRAWGEIPADFNRK